MGNPICDAFRPEDTLRADYQALGTPETSGYGEQFSYSVAVAMGAASQPPLHLGWLVTSVLLSRCPPILGLDLTLLSQL